MVSGGRLLEWTMGGGLGPGRWLGGVGGCNRGRSAVVGWFWRLVCFKLVVEDSRLLDKEEFGGKSDSLGEDRESW